MPLGTQQNTILAAAARRPRRVPCHRQSEPEDEALCSTTQRRHASSAERKHMWVQPPRLYQFRTPPGSAPVLTGR